MELKLFLQVIILPKQFAFDLLFDARKLFNLGVAIDFGFLAVSSAKPGTCNILF
jgi:hypothetical protein